MRLHPTKTGRRAVWLTLGGVVVVATAAAVVVFGGSDPPEATAASTAVVRRGTVTLAVSAAGTVEAAQTRGLGFSMAGTVTELNVRAATP